MRTRAANPNAAAAAPAIGGSIVGMGPRLS